MRSARTNSIGPEGTSVVAVYEDGVYQPTSTRRLDSFLDIERIDVLRGPYKTRTKAVFGQLSYAFSDRFTLTGGLRWNDDSKTLKTGEKDRWDDALWKAALEYAINDHMMSYVSASTGYLAGVRQGSHTRTDIRLIWQATDNFQIQLYYLNLEDAETLNWARVYNPAARPGITTLQANWDNPPTNGIIINYTF